MRLILIPVVVSGALTACQPPKPEKSDGKDKSNTETKEGKVDPETDEIPKDLASLKLSSLIVPSIPAYLVGQGSGIAAGKGQKQSKEACRVRAVVREVSQDLRHIAFHLCQLEHQPGIEAGRKVRFRLKRPSANLLTAPGDSVPPGESMPPGGGPNDDSMAEAPKEPTGDDPTYSIFMDGSLDNQMSVYLCSDDRLIQKTVVTGFKTSLVKGRFLVKQAIEGQGSLQMSGVFDNGVEAKGHVRQAIQASYEVTTGGQTQKLRNFSSLDLVESGPSTVETAAEMIASGDFIAAYRELGIAKVDQAVGTALVQRTVDAEHPPDHGGTGQFETSRAYFDSAGQALKAEDVPAAASGGALAVTEADLPKLLPESFAVAFDPGDWDCSGAEDATPDEAASAECEQAFAAPLKGEDCDPYVPGVEEQTPGVLDQRDQGPPELSLPPPPPDDQDT